MEPNQRRLDPYEELRVGKNATAGEIKKAYRRRSAKAHPDRGGSTEEMSRINVAYALIGTEDARARFDRGEGTAPKHTPESQAQTILATLWAQAIEKFALQDPPDMLKIIEQSIAEGVRKGQGEVDQGKKVLRKLEKMKKYLKPSKQSIGTLEHVLGEKIHAVEAKIRTSQELIDLAPLILEMLHTYGWEGPPPKVEQSAEFSGWIFNR